MNRQIRTVSALLSFAFLVLLGATTYIQAIGADSLNRNPYNNRALYRVKYIDRGPIYAGEKQIAYSEKTDSANRNRPEYIRKYSPDFRKYAHIVGILNSSIPPFGVENTEKATLMGEGKENLLAQAKQYFTGETKHGNGIRLTLVPKIQEAAWDYMGQKQGAVVVINYKTGEILAAVSKPDFDPTLFTDPTAAPEKQKKYYEELKKDPSQPLFNRVLSGNYQPGSTFKIITSAAILKNTDITPSTPLQAPLSYTPPGTTVPIYNYGRRLCGNGNPTLEHALVQSCNVPFAIKAVELGYDKIRDTAIDFGFNSENNKAIPLPLAPSVFPAKNPGKPLLAQSAFGQYDVRATPLEMALVAATVANDGKQVQPTFIKEILDHEGKIISQGASGEVARTPIDTATAQKLKTMMFAVVKQNYPKYAEIKGSRIGGKTGTAEVITKPGEEINDGWFIAFSDNPEKPYAIAMMIEGKHGGNWAERNVLGASDPLPIAMKIMGVALE